jgi:hypothetical protein
MREGMIANGLSTETGVASLLTAASILTSETVATDSGLATLLTAATLSTNDTGVTRANEEGIGKSNDDAIIIDDDEKSLDDECYIYDEVSVIDLKHYSQLNKMLT